MEKSKSYEIDGYKIKESYGNSGSVEMLVDGDTLFVPATTPLEIAGCSSFKIVKILRREHAIFQLKGESSENRRGLDSRVPWRYQTEARDHFSR